MAGFDFCGKGWSSEKWINRYESLWKSWGADPERMKDVEMFE